MNLRSASFLATAVLAFAYPAFAAAPPSLSGQWAIHISVAGTEKDLACTFVQADNKLTGNCTGDDSANQPLRTNSEEPPSPNPPQNHNPQQIRTSQGPPPCLFFTGLSSYNRE